MSKLTEIESKLLEGEVKNLTVDDLKLFLKSKSLKTTGKKE